MDVTVNLNIDLGDVIVVVLALYVLLTKNARQLTLRRRAQPTRPISGGLPEATADVVRRTSRY